MTTDDLRNLTDDALRDLIIAAMQEEERRAAIARAPQVIDQAVRAAQEASGTVKADGAEWKQPTGALDAYPIGAQVTVAGKTWESLTPANVWKPGTAGWRQKSTTTAVPDFVQPTGSTDTYKTGDRVTYKGAVYVSSIDNNAWSPADYPAGWKKEG